MSRRRKLPPLLPGYIRVFSAAVVCTDRSQHPRARIADLSGAALPGEDPSLMWRQTEHGEPVTGWQGAEGWRTFLFPCSRRPRDAHLRELRVMAAVAALSKSGIGDGRPVLDISLLC